MADENTMLRGCRTTCTPLPEDPVPGMAYVPFQQWSETYEPARALDDGTLFPVLNKPFYGRRGERTAAFKAAHFRRAVRDVGAAFVSGFASVLQRSGEKACCLPRGIR